MADRKVAEAQAEFAKIDLPRISSTLKSLANEPKKAIAFASNPDEFMRRELQGAYLPDGMHFHIQIEGDRIPSDTEIPEHQITYATTILFSDELKAEIVKAVGIRSNASDSPQLLYCEGCWHCMIAIVK